MNVPWAKWCDYGYKYRLVLVGWEDGSLVPGPDFCNKKAGGISTAGWAALKRRINREDNETYDPKEPELRIESWSEGSKILLYRIIK